MTPNDLDSIRRQEEIKAARAEKLILKEISDIATRGGMYDPAMKAKLLGISQGFFIAALAREIHRDLKRLAGMSTADDWLHGAVMGELKKIGKGDEPADWKELPVKE